MSFRPLSRNPEKNKKLICWIPAFAGMASGSILLIKYISPKIYKLPTRNFWNNLDFVI